MKLYDPLKIFFPCFIQPKLNGVYAELGTDGLFRSKTGKYFPAVQATRVTAVGTDLIYCGEFYVHGWSLQQILGAVTPDRPNELTPQVEFFVYDTKNPEKDYPQFTRLEQISSCFLKVPTYLIRTHIESDEYYRGFLQLGYEGAVYRPYTYGDILKRKPFKDAEFLCTGVVEGIGKRKGHVGKFVLTTRDGKTFHSGGGRVSYAKLAEYLVKPPIGKMITVRYQHTSDDGIPLCAQFIEVRDYE